MNADTVVRERVRAMEARALDYGPNTIDPDLFRFIAVMGQVNPRARADREQLPLLEPSIADAIVNASPLIGRLRRRSVELTDGPLDLTRQFWTVAERPTHMARRERELDQRNFIDVNDWRPDWPQATPRGLGLFTSTGSLAPYGMWRAELAAGWNSMLFPRPWDTWQIEANPSVAVFELTNAAEWAEFVATYPAHDGLSLCPDWRHAGQDWDAVHMTLPAIAATQGIRIKSRAGEIAPPYWSVESTLWLHWRFTSVTHLITEVDENGW